MIDQPRTAVIETDELVTLLEQVKRDFAAAHAEICKLQKIDPDNHTWPVWSTVAHTIAWIDRILETSALSAPSGTGGEREDALRDALIDLIGAFNAFDEAGSETADAMFVNLEEAVTDASALLAALSVPIAEDGFDTESCDGETGNSTRTEREKKPDADQA